MTVPIKRKLLSSLDFCYHLQVQQQRNLERWRVSSKCQATVRKEAAVEATGLRNHVSQRLVACMASSLST